MEDLRSDDTATPSSPWESMLDKAVRQGLSDGRHAPKTPPSASRSRKVDAALDAAWDASPALFFSSPIPEVMSAAPAPAPAPANDSVEEYDDDLDIAAELLAHAEPLRARVQSAVAKTVEELRRESGAERLRDELESWLLEAGRLEALVDEALVAASAQLREHDGRARHDRSELSACRGALEMHLAQAAMEAREYEAREAAMARAHEDQLDVLRAQLSQAHAEITQLSEHHGRKLREAREEMTIAVAAEVEAALAGQATAARQQAEEVAEARAARDEARQQLEARSRLVEASAEREESARRAWADERREWASTAATASAASAERLEELRSSLAESRRLLDDAQLAAAKAEARASAADDRSAAAERAREASDSVWHERLDGAQETISELRKELGRRDDLAALWAEERDEFARASSSHDAHATRLHAELAACAQEGSVARADCEARERELAQARAEIARLTEAALAQRAEADAARAEAERCRTELRDGAGHAAERGAAEAAASERKLQQQEERWLAQAARWRDEMSSLRTQLVVAQAGADDAREWAEARIDEIQATAKAEQQRASHRLAMSEQAGGARAAALLSELEKVRHGTGAEVASAMPHRALPPPGWEADPRSTALATAPVVASSAAACAWSPHTRRSPPHLSPTATVSTGRGAPSTTYSPALLSATTPVGSRIDPRATLARLLEDRSI